MIYYPTFVPDEGPLDAKILIVGEAPGEQEVESKRPFVGHSGEILLQCLNRAGVSRDEVRLANLFHYRPYGNKFEIVKDLPELKESVRQLYDYIEEHKPNVIAALGNWPLHYLTGRATFNNKKQIGGISKWRGSILPYIMNSELKVIPAFHPAFITRNRSAYPTFDFDITRIVNDAAYRERRYRQRRYIVNPQNLEIERWTEELLAASYLAVDIETIKNSSKILCVGFAPSPELAVCFVSSNFQHRLAIERVLAGRNKKVFQFGTFDTIQLLKLNGYTLADDTAQGLERPYYWDTNIAQHVMMPELPRSLEYLTSIYTREPYYKTEGRANIPDDTKGWSEKVDKNELYIYNCKDCCCTAEIFEEQQKEIAANPLFERIFNFEMTALSVAIDISNAGLPIDHARRKMLGDFLLSKWERKQFALDMLVGREVNVNSTPTVKKVLYDKEYLGLPVRRDHEGKETTGEDAIVSLISYCKDRMDTVVKDTTKQEWKERLAICKAILEIRGIRKVLSSYIRPKGSDDGRIRSTYKVGGTETGRWSASKYVDGTGLNAQTLPRDPIEVPDEVIEAALALAKQLEEEENEEAAEDNPE